MGAPVRSTPPALSTAITLQAYEFEFAQAVRVLHAFSDKKIFVGSRDDPRQDPVIFRSYVSFAVSSSEIHKFEALPTPELTVTFTGIAGIQGPLSDMFNGILVERIKAKDFGFRDFLDIFNHRITTFWYKLYTKIYPGLLDTKLEETEIGQSLMDLGGVRFHTEGTKMAPFGTLFWQRSSSAEGLREAISGYFNIPCRIKPFEGAWNIIEDAERSVLGKKFHCLGFDTVLGRKSYDQAAGFRIILGPMDYQHFKDFLPSENKESGFEQLRSLVTAYFDTPPKYKVELILKQSEIPRTALSGSFALQRNTWLNARKNYPHNGHVRLGFGVF